MARSGMANLILEVRKRTNSGTADYSVGGVNYFSDDQLQAILDRHQTSHKGWLLGSSPDYVEGDWVYTEYYFSGLEGGIEEAGTGSGWAVRNSAGESATGYTANYQAKSIIFSADTGGTDYYLSCREYDLERACAEIWEEKAGFENLSIDWETNNHKASASQKHTQALEMAKYWRKKARPQSVKMVRSDEA